MLLGLVSDSHDNGPLVEHVAAFFRERRVEMAFHLGDVTDPATLAPFNGFPLVVLRGNNDDELWPESWQQTLAGVRVGATHGHLRGVLAGLTEECDIVLHGHTHRRRVEREGNALVVNPGALYRARRYSCALLELPSRTVVFYGVDEHGVKRF